MNITNKERLLVLAGFAAGYERGHNDTVESCYNDAEECAIDWVNDALEDGGLEYLIEQMKGN